MKILLATVPPWLPYHPYLSIPLLTGILRENGFSVTQKDYNVEFYNDVLSSEEIRIQFERYAELGATHLDPKKQGLIDIKDFLIEHIDRFKSDVKQEDSYSNEEMIREAFEMLDLTLKSFSLSFPEIELALGEIEYRFDYYDINKVFGYIYDTSNFFRYYFEKYQLQEIHNENPDIIGFSVTTAEQLIPALAFAKVLQENKSDIKVFLGGSYISRVAHNLIVDNRFTDLIDCVLRGYSENTIIDLMQAYQCGRGFEHIDGILYKKDQSVIDNPIPRYRFTQNVPYPDFDNLPFNFYFSPCKKLPIELTKGCYWGKCQFCELREEIYTAKSAEHIFSEIEYLYSRYHVTHFLFVSASPSPKLLYAIATMIKEVHLGITWTTMIRPEPYIDEQFAQRLYDGGMRFAKIGFESGSQKMLDTMNKGLYVENNKKVLRALFRAGISVHGYFMYGYHGETIQDIKKTVSFIKEERSMLTSMATSFYTSIYKSAFGLRIYKGIDKERVCTIKNIAKNESDKR